MKTDTIFYSLFQEFPSIFFELINKSPTEAVAYEFTSREVNRFWIYDFGFGIYVSEA